MTLNDDNRAASSLMTNLSGFIIMANLSMLAIQGASYVFVAGESNQATLSYNILSVLAFLCFITSIIGGSKGITETATALSNSSWTIKTATNKFNFQAIISLLGVLLFLVASIFFTENKKDEANVTEVFAAEISSLNIKLSEIVDSMKNNQTGNIRRLENNVDELQRDLKHLEHKFFNLSSIQHCEVLEPNVDGAQLFCPHGFMLKRAEKHPSENSTLDK